jgi:hypothetical protein
MFAAKSVVSTIFVLAATFIALFVMFQVLGERAVFTAIPSIVITASVVSGVSFITKGSAAYLLMVCGIPFGLLFSNIYLIHMLATMNDPEKLPATYGAALTVALIGGISSAFGYLTCDSKKKFIYNPISTISATVASLLFLAMTVALLSFIGASFPYFFGNELALLMAMGMIFAGVGVAIKKGTALMAIAPSVTVCIAIIGGAIAAVSWIVVSMTESIIPAIKVLAMGLSTMALGLILYCLSIIWSTSRDGFEEAEFTSKNWHLVEVFTFVVFLALGPPTLLEMMSSAVLAGHSS